MDIVKDALFATAGYLIGKNKSNKKEESSVDTEAIIKNYIKTTSLEDYLKRYCFENDLDVYQFQRALEEYIH